MKNKTLLLGWDGADWKVIHPLVDKGLMPNMKRLIENGTIGNLRTLDPMYSPMLWSSIATGKRPYKHGVLGFVEPTPDGKNVRHVMSVSRKTKAIWNILTQLEKKNHVVGWWPSHPAEKINGVMVSNFFQNHVADLNEEWPLPEGTIHPKEEAQHFAQFRVHPHELTANHIGLFVPDLAKIDQKKDSRLSNIAKVTGHASSLHAAFTNIIRTKEWDFAALYLDALDHYSHGFMKFHPPKRAHISQSDFDIYNNVITSAYRFHDMMLGRIMDLIDQNTNLIIVSDHGFQPDHLRPRDIPSEPAGPAFEHNPLGIFAAMGPNIKKDHICYGSSLLDVTPTLLHMMDLPIGQDMDGKVMQSIFKDCHEECFVPSWDDIDGEDGRLKETDQIIQKNTGDEALKQLEDLGYINKQSDNLEQRVQSTKNECSFNLARAYIDGGKIKDAIKILEILYTNYPLTARYGIRLAGCYQLINELKKAQGILDKFEEQEQYPKSTIDYMQGSIFLSQGKPLKAIKKLKQAQSKIKVHNAQINVFIAQAYLKLGRLDNAKEAIDDELDYNPDNDQALFVKARILYNQKLYVEAKEYFLQALGLNFHAPGYHYYLGMSLFHIGNFENAANALENSIKLMPKNIKAKETLITIYRRYLDKFERADELKRSIQHDHDGIVYIVSGLPRSGTSMMMQMIKMGGIDLYTDEARGKDENNPKGYYEHKNVMNLKQNKAWVHEAKNKTVKVIAQLLKELPRNYHYKVIFMERNINEVMASQKKMLERSDKSKNSKMDSNKVKESYLKNLKSANKLLSSSYNFSVMYVDYKKVLDSPFEQCILINDFFDNKLNPEKMINVIDSSLYRERIESVNI